MKPVFVFNSFDIVLIIFSLIIFNLMLSKIIKLELEKNILKKENDLIKKESKSIRQDLLSWRVVITQDKSINW